MFLVFNYLYLYFFLQKFNFLKLFLVFCLISMCIVRYKFSITIIRYTDVNNGICIPVNWLYLYICIFTYVLLRGQRVDAMVFSAETNKSQLTSLYSITALLNTDNKSFIHVRFTIPIHS